MKLYCVGSREDLNIELTQLSTEAGQTEIEAAEDNESGQGPQQVIYKGQWHAFIGS
jgi:hypothetical protein